MKVQERGISQRVVVVLLAAVLALTLALAPRAEAYVYWANPGSTEGSTGTIGRANFDGTGVDRSFITGAGSQYGPAGVAVDAAHIYWVDDVTGTIGRANLDGTGVDRSFIKAITDTAGGLCAGGVAVDAAHVYWANDCALARIGRANLDGTGIDRSFINTFANALAVDAGHIYWNTFLGMGRANLDGSGVDPSFITGVGQPYGVAVDAAHVYWAILGGPLGNRGTIGRANVNGTGVDRSFITLRPLPSLSGVAVDAAHVYWYETLDGIGRANLNGTGIDRNFIDIKTAFGSSANGVAVDGLGPPPSNAFSFGRAKKNKQTGTAKLTVKVPGPGTLKLANTRAVKGAEQRAEAKGKEKLPVRAKGETKKTLKRKGKAKVRAEVSYTPAGGTPNTESKKIKLVNYLA